MLRLALLLALPVWSLAALLLVRRGGRGAALLAGAGVAILLAAWAGSRVGTDNPVSRTARWDRWLTFAMGAAMLLPPALATAWGVAGALGSGRAAATAAALGLVAGVAGAAVGLVLAVAVEVLWPH